MLGLWGTKERFLGKLETTSCIEDIFYEGHATITATPGSPAASGRSVFQDIKTKQLIMELTSMRAIHQQCLEHERIQLARVRDIIRMYCQLPRSMLSLQVDEVYVRIQKKDQARFIAQIENIKYCDLPSILPPFRKSRYQKASTSTAQVFRAKVAKPVYPGGLFFPPLACRTCSPMVRNTLFV